jgi:acetyl-CoA synthetase
MSPVQAEMGRMPVLSGGRAEYERLYKWSIEAPADFWAKMAEDLYWHRRWVPDHHRYNFDMRKGPISIEWFRGAQTNICYNALDRWVEAGRGNQACFLWEGNGAPVFRARTMSYREVLDETCRLANWLQSQGVKKGDAVGVYLPMICELPIAMLACARIGAMHTVVFAGFSAEALSQRLVDCKAKVVITATGVWRGAKTMGLKKIVDDALKLTEKGGHKVKSCLVFEKTALPADRTAWVAGRDVWWQEAVRQQSNDCPPEWVDAEDPLFLLYTSGSTGKPKGVMHSTGGYMVQAAVSTRYVFDLQPGDVFWCTADCGWVTGHTYLAYGPLLAGATQVLFGSTPTFPTVDRVWEVIERYRVRVFYTAPTLIRALMQHGDEPVKRHDRSSLRVLGTVGEPIGDAAWKWFDQVVGEGRCPIVDTWWQTETGSAMISPLAGAWPTKPGCATLPFFWSPAGAAHREG